MKRAALASIALVLAFSACNISIEVSTVVHRGGSGTFRILFAFDKELIDIIGSTDAGKESLKQLNDLPGVFGSAGWTVTRSEPNGGVRIDVRRSFAKPAELNEAIASLGTGGATAPAFLKIFRSFHLSASGGFIRHSTKISGIVDLPAAGLLPSADTKTGQELRALLSQAADKAFTFKVHASLPGSVGSYTGDPQDVSGGNVTWVARIDTPLEFSASAGGYSPTALVVLGVPLAALLAGGGALVMRRRRRRAPVPGWEVGEPSQAEETLPG